MRSLKISLGSGNIIATFLDKEGGNFEFVEKLMKTHHLDYEHLPKILGSVITYDGMDYVVQEIESEHYQYTFSVMEHNMVQDIL